MATQKFECSACKECFEPDKPADNDTASCPKCGELAKPVRRAARPVNRGYGVVTAARGGRGPSGGG